MSKWHISLLGLVSAFRREVLHSSLADACSDACSDAVIDTLFNRNLAAVGLNPVLHDPWWA